MVKNMSAMQETWVGKIPWRRGRLPTPVFLPGEFHEHRSLVGYSPWGLWGPWGCKESDKTEKLILLTFTSNPNKKLKFLCHNEI